MTFAIVEFICASATGSTASGRHALQIHELVAMCLARPPRRARAKSSGKREHNTLGGGRTGRSHQSAPAEPVCVHACLFVLARVTGRARRHERQTASACCRCWCDGSAERTRRSCGFTSSKHLSNARVVAGRSTHVSFLPVQVKRISPVGRRLSPTSPRALARAPRSATRSRKRSRSSGSMNRRRVMPVQTSKQLRCGGWSARNRAAADRLLDFLRRRHRLSQQLERTVDEGAVGPRNTEFSDCNCPRPSGQAGAGGRQGEAAVIRTLPQVQGARPLFPQGLIICRS